MKLLVLFILLHSSIVAQIDFKSDADTYADRLDSLIKYKITTAFSLPDRSVAGGSVHGFYYKGKLVSIRALNAMAFHWETQHVYFDEQGRAIKAVHEVHSPLEAEFFETLPENTDFDTMNWSRMEYNDSTYVYYLSETPFVDVYVGQALIRKTHDPTLVENYVGGIASMVKELAHSRVLDWQPSRNIEGDFSFTQNWEYPMGVEVNAWGQVSCDGFCPDGASELKGEDGRIPEASLDAFYALVDTTHQAHSLQSEFSQYELADSEYIDFVKTANGALGTTRCDAGNHSSLHVKIDGGHFYAWVEFVSITNLEPQRLELSKGTLTLDDALLEQGIYKGAFDFEFTNTLEPEMPLTWKGIFYDTIEE